MSLKRLERTAIRTSFIRSAKCHLASIFADDSTRQATANASDGRIAIVKEIENQVHGRMQAIDDVWVQSNCRKYVNLGCGVDMRSWRIELPPSSTVYDVDKLRVIQSKLSTLERNSFNPNQTPSGTKIKYLPLRYGIHELQKSYFNEMNFSETANLWCMEGFLEYLNPGSRANLISFVSCVPQKTGKIVVSCVLPSIFEEFPPNEPRQRVYFGGWSPELWTTEKTLTVMKDNCIQATNVRHITDHCVVIEGTVRK
eukprot:TRINITY_DN27662_c0_g1_i1.p1 TRINITY_DN27662_c0_g1~~TRINITY_DN27662_c0_g1_i1.p1  ORF type:complete len:255 (+),score=23.50 TRINITY_DN27662_c0_g1_i1:262-1026(+)